MLRRYILILFIFVNLVAYGQFAIESNSIFGGNGSDEAKDIAVNAANTFLYFGGASFSSDNDLPGNAGASDFWIMKREIDGTPLWSRNFGGPGIDELEVIMPHSDGGVLAFGTTHTDQGQFGDILGLAGGWLMRTNTNGSLIDGKIFGGFTTESAVDAFRRANGDVTMVLEAGSITLNGQFNHGVTDVWVVHVNATLDIQWTSLLGGTQSDVPVAMTQDIHGNIYIVARTQSDLPGLPPNRGEEDVWVMKLEPGGEVLWEKTFGGALDDIPTDIIVHPDGYVYVSVESRSNDGDFNENEGINDIWLLQLSDDNGTLLRSNRYGGTGNDFNTQLTTFGDDHIVISSTTTSEDGDLTGNKGLADVWVVQVDLLGNIVQQMNYGGSVNDFAADIINVDSVLHLVNSTFSSDKNVPLNSLASMDMWYFSLNPDSDSCSLQFECRLDTILTNVLLPPDDNALLCVTGCNEGYGPGPNFAPGICDDFTNATAYFKVITDTMAELLTLSVSSFDFNQPRIAIFRTTNCNTYQQVSCTSGEFGFAIIEYLEVQPLTTYVVAVSDAEGNIGGFDLCATSIDVDFCNEGDRIYATATSLGSPLNGPYKPGEEVSFCYELYDWNKLNCNGFQGLLPTFGPAWDSTSFDFFGQPIQMDSFLMPAQDEGYWQWEQIGVVHYNIANPINGYGGGQGLPPGWYFTNTGDPPPATTPDETTGDINDCTPTADRWKVCFTLTVEDECETNLDASIVMKTFGDGELGIEPSLTCVYDQEEVFHAIMQCCLNPTIQNIPDFSICTGDTLHFSPITNLLPPVTYTWSADPDPFIEGAHSAVNAASFFQVLTSEAVIPLEVHYSIRAQGGGCFTDQVDFDVTINPRPSSTINITGPSIVCSGSTVNITFLSSGTPPFQIGLYRDNQFFANVLSESIFISIPVDPVFSSRLRIGTLEDANCEGDGFGFVDVTIKPIQTSFIDTVICEGDSIIVGDESFDETGTFSVTLEGQAENNCDSTIELSLSVLPSIFETIDEVICQGDTLFVLGVPYTTSTSQLIEYSSPEGCVNFIQLDLVVQDTFSSNIFQTICFGDTLNFFGLKLYQEGIYSHSVEIQPGCFEETVLHLDVLPQIILNDFEIIPDDGNDNGQLIVEFIGGTPPFTFLWSSGHVIESLFNIPHGEYSVTITDRNGCTAVFHFDVPFINATDDVGALPELMCWPTLLSHDDDVQLYNLSKSDMVLRAVEWLDMNGKVIHHENNILLRAASVYAMPLEEDMTTGMYILHVKTKTGISKQFKIVVQ